MSCINSNILAGASGSAGGDKVYVDDVFSTYLYISDGNTQTVNNGIKLGAPSESLNGKTITDTTGGGADYSKLNNNITSSANSDYYYGSIDCYIDYGSAVVSTSYSLFPQGDNSQDPKVVYNTPDSVTAYGSNNASSWTTLGTTTFTASDWAEGQATKAVFENLTAYRYYRLTVAGTKSLQEWHLGIGQSGEGGLVWFKSRTSGWNHILVDSERSGANAAGNSTLYPLVSNSSGAQLTNVAPTSFNNNGYTTAYNIGSSEEFVSWTFRKAPGFFDIVTYSGNDTARAIPHNLGSVPGMIIVKKINDSGGWYTYHRSAGNTKWLNLASSNDASTVNLWNNQTPTASEFYLSSNQNPNGTGYQYVAYIFAHDEPVFGTDEDESIIKCGSYSGNDNAPHTIDVGFEPQFVMIKNIDSNASNWIIADMMRTKNLKPNTSEVESHPGTITYTSSGFTINNNNIFSNALDDYIYMAIRRPNKPPTAATEVFDIKTSSSDGGSGTLTSDTVLADMVWSRGLEASRNGIAFDRLTRQLQILNSTGGMAAASWYTTDHQTGFLHAGYWATNDIVDYTFKRTPGFFDVVTYTGNSGANTIYHNLSAVPELFFLKNRSGGSLRVEIVANHDAGNTTSSGSFSFAEYFNTGITDSYVSTTNVGTSVNANGGLYLLYLFATLPGISKIGTYSGNTGYAINVPCGFTNGARFIMIKRTNGTGDWYVWDSVRGIIGGNDPYFLLNSTAIEVTNTDYIDPLSTGFTVTASAPAALNVTGGTYLFLAIA